MLRTAFAFTTVLTAAIAAPSAFAADVTVPASKLSSCTFASAHGGDALELNPVLIRGRDARADAGFCRARVRCESAEGRPATLEAICRASIDRSCPAAPACVWQAKSLRAISPQTKPLLAANDFVVTGTVDGFDQETVTIALRSKRLVRLPSSAFATSLGLAEGQLVYAHLTEKQMLDHGLFAPAASSSRRKPAAEKTNRVPLVE